MSRNLIAVIGSITTANRFEKRLVKDHGISVYISHTPKALSSKGCSYSIKTDLKNLPLVMETIRRYNFKTSGIYIAEKSEGKEFYHALS